MLWGALRCIFNHTLQPTTHCTLQLSRHCKIQNARLPLAHAQSSCCSNRSSFCVSAVICRVSQQLLEDSLFPVLLLSHLMAKAACVLKSRCTATAATARTAV